MVNKYVLNSINIENDRKAQVSCIYFAYSTFRCLFSIFVECFLRTNKIVFQGVQFRHRFKSAYLYSKYVYNSSYQAQGIFLNHH